MQERRVNGMFDIYKFKYAVSKRSFTLKDVAACLGIGNIVCRCIECRVGSPKPRARNIESEKL